MRVILTGAGTSGFIGECLVPYLAAQLPCRVEAIPTTDLVCAPYLYFKEAAPTLLVSFGRSGSSPESVAAADLADQLVGDIRHLAITCNPDGALARKISSAGNGMAILLPEETNDQSFVMTSSFSCMTYAALAVLCGIDGMQARVDRIAQAVEAVIAAQARAMRMLAGRGYERVVYLGSHIFKGLAREAALKLLELTDGGMIVAYDSPLGFRHGPKTMVNDRTLVVIFLSNDAYTRRYDMDLLQEIKRDGKAGCVLAFSGRDEAMPAGSAILSPQAMGISIFIRVITFTFFGGAFEAAIGRGLSPDNPNISGIVNPASGRRFTLS